MCGDVVTLVFLGIGVGVCSFLLTGMLINSSIVDPTTQLFSLFISPFVKFPICLLSQNDFIASMTSLAGVVLMPGF